MAENPNITRPTLEAIWTKIQVPDLEIMSLLCKQSKDTTTQVKDFVYDGKVQRMERNMGVRNVNGVPDYKNTITAQLFDQGLRIGVDEKGTDQVGFYQEQLTKLKALTVPWRLRLLAAALEGGTTATNHALGGFYDDTAFFADVHTAWTGDNLLAGAGVSDANVITQHEAAINALRGYTDRIGKKVHLSGANLFHVVPSQRFEQFNNLFNVALHNAAGATNIYYKRARILECSELTEANDFYTFLLNGDMPFVEFVFEDPKLVVDNTKIESERAYYYYLEAQAVVGPAHAWSALKTVVT